MTISPARIAAFDILLRVEKDNAHSADLLADREESLIPVDRSLCHDLTLGTLRHQILLDAVIDTLSLGKKLDIEVRIALRLAIYQLKFLTRVPQYSAINESVQLVQRAKKTSAKGLVNAVLRRSSRETIEPSFDDEIGRLSVETSHPRWLIERWTAAVGVAEAEALAAANNRIPPLAFRPLLTLADESALAPQRARRSENAENCFIAVGAGRQLYDLARAGQIYIQSEASQMTAQLIHAARGGRILDVCAAPGGKTGLISSRNPHASLVAAGDISGRRVDYLRRNCIRQGESAVSVLQYDAQRDLPFAEKCFDAVSVDAPCSGTGTIRQNPEIRYKIEEMDITRLAAKQLQILTTASKVVADGGLLVYSTCSLEREENEAVCDEFGRQNIGFRSVIPDVPARFLTGEGFARTWPHRDDMEGFFIAVFRRK
jgi:16S rRNA (cytosine967-C5)-methyltransferase